MDSLIIREGIKANAGLLEIDTIPASWMEGILSTVQNLATDRHMRQLPDGTRIYGRREVSDMRMLLPMGVSAPEPLMITSGQLKPIVDYILQLAVSDNFPILLQQVSHSFDFLEPNDREENINMAIARIHLGIEAAHRCAEVITHLERE